MHPSSIVCRAQESAQRERAANSHLPQVRELAESSAAAWAKEGQAAIIREQRETGRANRAKFATAIKQGEGRGDDAMSENPDRYDSI